VAFSRNTFAKIELSAKFNAAVPIYVLLC